MKKYPSQWIRRRGATVAVVLLALLLTECFLQGSFWAVSAQKDDIVRNALRSLPTTSEGKGFLGELNVYPALKSLGKDTSYELEERYVSHRVLQHGIDAIYRDVKTKRFNVVEAKATSHTGRLNLGLLPVRVEGERQMDTAWVRKKLDEAYRAAREVWDDSAAPAAERLSARRTLQLADEIRSLKLRTTERTPVVTRLSGIAPDLSPDATLSDELLKFFDHVIEVQRSGRVIRVHR